MAEHPALEFCPPAKSFRDRSVDLQKKEVLKLEREIAETTKSYRKAEGLTESYERPSASFSPKEAKGIGVVSSIPLLWECASDKIAEAERLLKDRS